MLTKFWNNLITPNHLVVAQQQLATARLRLMEAEANASYASLMIKYYGDTIKRHEALLSNSVATPQFSTEEAPMKK